MKTLAINIPEYIFDEKTNPFVFSVDHPISLQGIAVKLESLIGENIDKKQFIIRGLQSSRHNKLKRDELVDLIKLQGSDMYASTHESNSIFAARYEKGVILKILEGFHKYKPKSEERPQYPVDIWIMYNEDFYQNIEYLHPRHSVPARDKWKLKMGAKHEPELIIIVN
jgi:hypothetical protein